MAPQYSRSLLTSVVLLTLAACSSSTSDTDEDTAGALNAAGTGSSYEQPTGLITYGDVTDQPDTRRRARLYVADDKEVFFVTKTDKGVAVNARDIDASTPAREIWKAPSLLSLSLDAKNVYTLACEFPDRDVPYCNIFAIPRTGGEPVALQTDVRDHFARIDATADDTIVIERSIAGPVQLTSKAPNAPLRQGPTIAGYYWKVVGKTIYSVAPAQLDAYSLATNEHRTLFGPNDQYEILPERTVFDDSDGSFMIEALKKGEYSWGLKQWPFAIERTHDGTMREVQMDHDTDWTPRFKIDAHTECSSGGGDSISCMRMGATAGPISASGEGLPKDVRILEFPHSLEDRSSKVHIEDVRVLSNRVVFMREGKLMGKKYP